MIKNITSNTILTKNKKECKTILSKAKGLMFTKKIKDTGLIFDFYKEKRIGMHMMFVFYPIDVLFLGANKNVVEIKKNFKPFTYYKTKNKIRYAIELPQGTIKKTKKEDKIKI